MPKELNFDLKQIRSFLTAVNVKSFTKASRILGVGQATISHHIQLLEENLGVNLIGRSSKSFEITSEGETFIRFCDNLIRKLDDLKNDLSDESSPGVFTIAASTIPSTYILPRVLPGVYRKIPGVAFKIEVSDSREAIEKVKERMADAAVTGKILKHPSLNYTVVWEDEIVLVAPAGMLPGKIKLNGLAGIPLIMREKGSGTRYSYEEMLNKNGVRVSNLNVVLECSTSESVRESVLSGMGAAFISRLAVERDLESKRIEIIAVEKISIKRKFYLAVPAGKKTGKPVSALVDEFKSIRTARS